MELSTATCRPHPRRNSRFRFAGFTLVEIMVVVVIIGLLASVALPAFQRVRRRSINSRVVNDLRIFSQVFETYLLQNGALPPDAAPGQVPAGMAGLLPSTWTKPSVIGGQWEWDNDGTLFAITLYNPTVTAAQMNEIDAMIDDGDPATGLFVRNGSEWNYLIRP